MTNNGERITSFNDNPELLTIETGQNYDFVVTVNDKSAVIIPAGGIIKMDKAEQLDLSIFFALTNNFSRFYEAQDWYQLIDRYIPDRFKVVEEK